MSFSLSFGSTQSDLRFESYAHFRERMQNRKLGFGISISLSDRISLGGPDRIKTSLLHQLSIFPSTHRCRLGLETPVRIGMRQTRPACINLHKTSQCLRLESSAPVRIGTEPIPFDSAQKCAHALCWNNRLGSDPIRTDWACCCHTSDLTDSLALTTSYKHGSASTCPSTT